jgi:hypothetical protein
VLFGFSTYRDHGRRSGWQKGLDTNGRTPFYSTGESVGRVVEEAYSSASQRIETMGGGLDGEGSRYERKNTVLLDRQEVHLDKDILIH